MSNDLQVLIQITDCICECGNKWTASSFIFRTESNSFNYDVTDERYEKLKTREVTPCGHFHRTEQFPICAACLAVTPPSGWPSFRNIDPHKTPHDFRYKEPKDYKAPRARAIKKDEQKAIEDLLNE